MAERSALKIFQEQLSDAALFIASWTKCAPRSRKAGPGRYPVPQTLNVASAATKMDRKITSL